MANSSYREMTVKVKVLLRPTRGGEMDSFLFPVPDVDETSSGMGILLLGQIGEELHYFDSSSDRHVKIGDILEMKDVKD